MPAGSPLVPLSSALRGGPGRFLFNSCWANSEMKDLPKLVCHEIFLLCLTSRSAMVVLF